MVDEIKAKVTVPDLIKASAPTLTFDDPHNILSSSHLDALVASVAAGDLIHGNATPKWARLAKGSDGQFLKIVNGLPTWGAGGGGGGVWGSITGTLSEQTDLQSALNGKAASSHGHAKSDISQAGSWLLAEIPDLSSLYALLGHGHAQLHDRSHSLVSTSDHTSAVAVGKHFKADANGLPIQASNTDAEIAAAVAASHAAVTNRLAGITPTFATFDTNPPNPDNITDGNWTTWSGEGVKTLAAPGTVGDILFDLGAPYPVLVITQFNVHKDSGDGTLGVSLAQSDDGVTYVSLTPAWVSGVVASSPRGAVAIFVYARYLRIRTTASATTVSSVYHVNFASVMALQLL